MTPELLQFYAGCYTQDPTDPLCSPLFGDLTGLPPSMLFVGGDEVMLDDTRALRKAPGRRMPQQAAHRPGAVARLCAVLPQREYGAGF